MTAPDLADALAAQRAAYRPEHLPPFHALLERKRRRDRRRHVAVAAAAAVAAITSAGVSAVASDFRGTDAVEGVVAAGGEAASPDKERLVAALGALTPPVSLTAVKDMAAGNAGIGDRPHELRRGVIGQTADSTTSVSWAVLRPALTNAEAIAVASSVEGSDGLEQGQAVGVPARSGPVRAVAYRFGDGSFIRIWAWSEDGGVVTITSGAGATTPDRQVQSWQQAAQELLEQ
jgi:hypothetical protein